MKRIFLTSGLVLCMACPAFADLTPATVGNTGNGLVYPIGQNDGATATQLGGAQVDGACVEPAMGVYSGSTTLRAKWTADPFKIIYKAGTTGSTHGNNFSQTQPNTATDNLVVVDTLNYDDAPGDARAANTFSIYGYHFDTTQGWLSDRTIYGSTADNTTSVQYVPETSLGARYNVSNDTILTAKWAPDTYTVTYNCGTGLGSPNGDASVTATYDAAFTWKDNSDASDCHKQGYYFTGWTCTVAAAATTNNTAKTLITNGGVSCSGHVCTGTAYAGEYDSSDSNAQAPNYWNVAYLNNGAAISCAAQYAANTITLHYDSDGGSAVADGECVYDSSITLPANPTKTGYTFAGWEVSDAANAQQTPESGLAD